MVSRRNSTNDSGWPNNVHIQGDPVQPAGLQLPTPGVVRRWAQVDFCPATDAEI